MKISFNLLFIFFMYSTLSAGPHSLDELDFSLLFNKGSVSEKRYERLRRLYAKDENYDSDISCDCDDLPLIYDTIWPFFCLNHLIHNSESCSSWKTDKKGSPILEFSLSGNALAFVDKKLIQRIGDRWHLIPKLSLDCCDYGTCNKCQEKIIRSYQISTVESHSSSNQIINHIPFILYHCNCLGLGKWYNINVVEEEHHSNSAYCLEFKKKCSNWVFCQKPPIFPGYFNWSYQTYFPFFEQFLTYIEKNPSCDCYWPHCNSNAEKISDSAFMALSWIAEFTALEDMMGTRKDFSPYTSFVSIEEFVRSLLVHAYFYSHYRRILNDLDQYSFKNCLASEEYQKIHQRLIAIESKMIPYFQKSYSECLQKHPHPKIFYERGMTYFHKGEFFESFDDIRELISYAEKNNFQDLLTSDLYLQEGKLLNEMLSYDEAIISLTKAIKKNPKK